MNNYKGNNWKVGKGLEQNRHLYFKTERYTGLLSQLLLIRLMGLTDLKGRTWIKKLTLLERNGLTVSKII